MRLPTQARSGQSTGPFLVKSYDTETAAPVGPPLLGPDTAVISLQNGIDNEAKMAATIGWQHVLGGSAYIFGAIRSPGVVVASGPEHRLRRVDRRRPSPRCWPSSPPRLPRPAGSPHDGRGHPAAKWEKYVLLAALSAASAATQLPLGDIRRSPAAVALLRDLMTEAWVVGRASGVRLDDGLVDRQSPRHGPGRGVEGLVADDLITGHRMEVDALQGATLQLGREFGVPTPNMTAAYAILEPWAMRKLS